MHWYMKRYNLIFHMFVYATFPFISISSDLLATSSGLHLLFVKQWCTTAPKKLPTRKEATDEGMVDAATTTPVLRGSPSVGP